MPPRIQYQRRPEPSENFQRAFEEDMGRALAEMQARSGTARQLAPLLPGDEASGIIMREAPARGAATISEMMESPTALEPRFVPGALVERPDAPDILQQELIDPVLEGYGMGPQIPIQQSRALQPKTFEMGNELVQIDPTTGTAKSIYSRTQAPQEMSARQKLEYADLLKQRQVLMGKPSYQQTPQDKEKLATIDSKISNFFGAPVQPAAAAPPDLLGTNAPIRFGATATNTPSRQVGRFRIISR